MKKMLLSIALLFSTLSVLGASKCKPAVDCKRACTKPKTIFLPRSQANNRARELSGWHMSWQNDTVNPRDEGLYGTGSVTLEYSRSFRDERITDFLFGEAAQNGTVFFSGSQVTNRGSRDVLADYFGLPTDYEGAVKFEPRIQNVIVDFNAYFGLDKWCEGMYLDVHFPLVHTRWNLNPCDCTSVLGTNSYEFGYMDKEGIDRVNLPKSPLEFWRGNATWGDMTNPLCFSKVSCDTLTKTKLADVHFLLGCNWCQNDLAHFGGYVRAAVPTGNRPNAEYLFEPIVGNGGHFELGGGFNSHAVLWENDQNHQLAAYLDVYVSHQFCTVQRRSFDFEDNDAGSRYILVAEYSPIPLDGTGTVVPGCISNPGVFREYAENLLPAANLTALCCRVSTQLQSELTLKLEYVRNRFSFDFGYNFWGRTKEKLEVIDEIDEDRYALKGDTYLFGVAVPGAASPGDLNTVNTNAARAGYPTNCVKLSAMQENESSLFSGGNFNSDRFGGTAQLNPGVDSPVNAQTRLTAGGPTVLLVSPIVGLPATPIVGSPATARTAPMKTSGAIDLIAENVDFDPESARRPSQISHKIFVHLGYTGKEREVPFGPTTPYVGVGGEVEFGSKSQVIGNKRCECSGALSQWGVWLKGGFSY